MTTDNNDDQNGISEEDMRMSQYYGDDEYIPIEPWKEWVVFGGLIVVAVLIFAACVHSCAN